MADEKQDRPSDDQILGALKETLGSGEVFKAAHNWCFEEMSQSVHSRGDFFDRNSSVVFERAGKEVLKIPVKNLTVTIGRGEQADCRLDDEGVSRSHCRLERIGGLVRISDNDSKNGIMLNGKKIMSEELCDGDELIIGSISLRIRRR